jgi:hypothetical protein
MMSQITFQTYRAWDAFWSMADHIALTHGEDGFDDAAVWRAFAATRPNPSTFPLVIEGDKELADICWADALEDAGDAGVLLPDSEVIVHS